MLFIHKTMLQNLLRRDFSITFFLLIARNLLLEKQNKNKPLSNMRLCIMKSIMTGDSLDVNLLIASVLLMCQLCVHFITLYTILVVSSQAQAQCPIPIIPVNTRILGKLKNVILLEKKMLTIALLRSGMAAVLLKWARLVWPEVQNKIMHFKPNKYAVGYSDDVLSMLYELQKVSISFNLNCLQCSFSTVWFDFFLSTSFNQLQICAVYCISLGNQSFLHLILLG